MNEINEIKKLRFSNFRNTTNVTKGCQYWERNLLQKASRIAVIENIEYLPAIDPVLFLETILWCGYHIMINTEKWGVIAPSAGIRTSFGLTEFDFNGHPAAATLANPKLIEKPEYSIEPYCHLTAFPNVRKDKCVAIFCTSDDSVITEGYPIGIRAFIQRTARFLADLDSSMTIALINGRKSSVLKVSDSTTEETVKAVNRMVKDGEVDIAIIKSDDPIFEKIEAPFSNISATDINQLFQLRFNALREFWAELGVNKLGEKKERLITDEAEGDQSSTIAIDNILTTIQKGLDVANVLFEEQLQGKKLKVKLNQKLVDKINEEYFKESEETKDEIEN